jgi:predicted HTH transcriptional regulator
MEFFNPGALPKSLATIMREDISIPCNGILAKLFRVVRLAENGGYGFDKMIRGWTPYAGTEPQFATSMDSVKATFGFKTAGKEKGDAINTTGGPKGGPKIMTSRQKDIYDLIKGDPSISRNAMAVALSINVSALRKHLDALRAKGIIAREGPAKGGHWEILIND